MPSFHCFPLLFHQVPSVSQNEGTYWDTILNLLNFPAICFSLPEARIWIDELVLLEIYILSPSGTWPSFSYKVTTRLLFYYVLQGCLYWFKHLFPFHVNDIYSILYHSLFSSYAVDIGLCVFIRIIFEDVYRVLDFWWQIFTLNCNISQHFILELFISFPLHIFSFGDLNSFCSNYKLLTKLDCWAPLLLSILVSFSLVFFRKLP